MSKQMVYTEKSSTVLDASFIVVNDTSLESAFPLDAPDGTPSAPSYTFETNTATGMCLVADNLTFGANGAVAMAVSMDGNVAVGGGAPVNYGATTPGEGVLFMRNATTNPVGVPAGGTGGILYVDGNHLFFLNSLGATYTLTSKSGDVVGPASSTANAAVAFDGVTGKLIQNSSLLITPTSTLTVPNGAPAIASYTYAGNTDTGMYLGAVGDARVVTGGTDRLSFTPTMVTSGMTMLAPDGTAGAPAYSFTANPATGVLLDGTQLQVAVGGTVGLSVDNVGATNNVALCSSAPVNYGAGTPGVGVVFVGEANSIPTGVPNGGSGGILYVTGNNLTFLTSSGTARNLTQCLVETSGTTTLYGVARFDGTTGRVIKDTSTLTIDAAGQWSGPLGALGGVTYGFTGDADTGLYSPGAGQMALVTGGVAQVEFDAANTILNLPMRVLDGSATAPAFGFTSSPNSGFFRESTATAVTFTSAGTPAFSLAQHDNVSFCGGNSSTFGGGHCTMFIHQATTIPTTNPTGGGILYVDGIHLYFRNTAGVVSTLSDFVVGPGTSINDAVATFNGTDGETMQSSAARVSDAGALQVGDGTVATPALSFTNNIDTGMYISGTDVYLTTGGGAGGVGQLRVGGSAVTGAVVIREVNGSASAPSYTFTGDTNTGLYLVSSSRPGISVGGILSLFAERAGAVTNVSMCGSADYGGGAGVLCLNDVVVAPVGTLTSGGILYVSGTNLIFHDDGGGNLTLTAGSVVSSPPVSVTDALAYWDGTGGDAIGSATGVTSDNTRLNGALRYDSNALSVYQSGNNAVVGFAGATLSVGAAGVQVDAVPLHADTSVRVGGVSGVNESLSGSVYTINNLNAGGTFEWQQNGSTIAATDPSMNLTMAANALEWSNATETMTIGNASATEYAVTTSTTGATADDIAFSVGGVVQARIRAQGLVASNTVFLPSGVNYENNNGVFLNANGTIASPSYSFHNNTDSGFMYDPATAAVGLVHSGALSGCVTAAANTCNIACCTPTFPATYDSGDGVIFVGQNVTPPSINANGCYLYVDSGSNDLRMNVDVADSNANCVLNAASKRARITLTMAVADATPEDLDGETWTDVDSSGVTGVAAGALVTGDTESTVMVEVRAEWASSATGYRRVSITTGAGHAVEATVTSAAVSGDVTAQTVRLIRRLGSGDGSLQFAAQAYQNSTAALGCNFTMTLIRMN